MFVRMTTPHTNVHYTYVRMYTDMYTHSIHTCVLLHTLRVQKLAGTNFSIFGDQYLMGIKLAIY